MSIRFFLEIPDDSPAMTTIRLWVLRLGLFLLRQPIPEADDWIFLIDHTCELGPGKVLVILGVRQSQLQPGAYNLAHQDVELLHLEPMDTSTGDLMYGILTDLSDRVGVPRQIISDHGSDLVKAERLFVADHPGVRVTWDITHCMARFLLAEIATDEHWQRFRQACSETRNAVQQTPLRFLAPPSQKGASRCEHFDRLVLWGDDLLRFAERADFHQISIRHQCDSEARDQLKDQLDGTVLKLLEPLQERVFTERQGLEQTLRETLDADTFRTWSDKIIEASDCGRRMFMERYGWVCEYQDDLRLCYCPIVRMVYAAEKLVKREGLHEETATRFREHLDQAAEIIDARPVAAEPSTHTDRVAKLQARIVGYMNEQSCGCPIDESLLGTSDVLESLFGKYKTYSSRSSFKELGASLLLLPVLTARLTSDMIRNALEAVSVVALKQWVESNIGITALAQRIKAFRRPKPTENRHEQNTVSTAKI